MQNQDPKKVIKWVHLHQKTRFSRALFLSHLTYITGPAIPQNPYYIKHPKSPNGLYQLFAVDRMLPVAEIESLPHLASICVVSLALELPLQTIERGSLKTVAQYPKPNAVFTDLRWIWQYIFSGGVVWSGGSVCLALFLYFFPEEVGMVRNSGLRYQKLLQRAIKIFEREFHIFVLMGESQRLWQSFFKGFLPASYALSSSYIDSQDLYVFQHLDLVGEVAAAVEDTGHDAAGLQQLLAVISQVLAAAAGFCEFEQRFEGRGPASELQDGLGLLWAQLVEQHQFSQVAVEDGFEIDVQLHSVVFQTLVNAFVPVSNFKGCLHLRVHLLANFGRLRWLGGGDVGILEGLDFWLGVGDLGVGGRLVVNVDLEGEK